jgi:hypothetical protein
MSFTFFYKEYNYNYHHYENVLKYVHNAAGDAARASKCLNVSEDEMVIGQWYHCKCEFIFTDELENIMRSTNMFFGSVGTGIQGMVYLFDNLSIRKK